MCFYSGFYFKNIRKTFLDEIIITVRAMDFCTPLLLQEFARIILEDEVNGYQRTPEDYTPLADRPSYTSLNYPKTVSY